MTDILVAIGLFLVIEGLVYALAPYFVRAMAARLPELTDQQLRGFGLASVMFGVFLVWLVKG
ncbi:DUF2065 domain-containing protein [Pararhizobium haloflavum]|uniref:DUF2065 domain-containing protein n=1 Tax=Pararhizobium haloflavum TaxID=2037914 RepID=UPI000C17FAE7|nr:DUF2065 domain-containing protein [Pararhizobium haloflavum]